MFNRDDRVLVIGAGRSGLAAAEAVRSLGAAVSVFDDKERAQLGDEAAKLEALGAQLVDRDRLDHEASIASAAIVSPGIPDGNPALLALQRRDVPVYSEIELAYRLSRAPIVAVTGSKGKSTTTALIARMLSAQGFRVHTGGNIGNPLVREAMAAQPGDWIVAEVSSFQLERIDAFAPRVSVLLNVGADHLDRYPSIDAYASAKLRIFKNQTSSDHSVVNADDAFCRAAAAAGKIGNARVHWFSAQADPQAQAVCEDGALVLRQGGGRAPVVLARTDELRLRGGHNVENALAAALAATQAGASATAVGEALRAFEPLPHRLITVAISGGVEWIDDSKATNPEAVIRALETFDAPVVLIAGGEGKNLDFSKLGQAASRRAKAVVLIGRAATDIASHISGIPVRFASSLQEAVDAAAATAAAGDVVLLSPGCASFDMFESAEQRGEQFAQLACKRATAVHAR
jgi:UDP-N-acetylmuramoylalanine--D-glutamate ligase